MLQMMETIERCIICSAGMCHYTQYCLQLYPSRMHICVQTSYVIRLDFMRHHAIRHMRKTSLTFSLFPLAFLLSSTSSVYASVYASDLVSSLHGIVVAVLCRNSLLNRSRTLWLTTDDSSEDPPVHSHAIPTRANSRQIWGT